MSFMGRLGVGGVWWFQTFAKHRGVWKTCLKSYFAPARLGIATGSSYRSIRSICSTTSGSSTEKVTIDQRQDPPWYEKGLPFDCTKCGKCCRLSEGRLVNVNNNEIREMATLLKRSMEDIYSAHTTIVADAATSKKKLVLRAKTNKAGENVCTFLGEDNRCQVYQSRPTQCRTYPFWPEMLSSDFEWAAESTRCEGIPQLPQSPPGEEYTKHVQRQEIRQELVIETLSRLSQQGGDEESNITTGLTYDEANHLLQEIDAGLISEFERDFLLDNRRVVLEDNRFHRVVDCYGDVISEEVNMRDEKVEAKRIIISKDVPWLSQSEMYVYEDGSHCFSLLPQRIQQGLLVGGLLLEKMPEEEEHGENENENEHEDCDMSLALLGSGACVFSTVLSKHFPKIKIDVVDLDARMLEMAEKHFGAEFGSQTRVTKHAMDAQAFVKESNTKFSFILIDICCVESGSIPPPSFTSTSFFSHLMNHTLADEEGLIGIHLAHADTEEIDSRIESICESLVGTCTTTTTTCRVYSLMLNEESGGLRSAAVLIHKTATNAAPVTANILQDRARARPILASLANEVLHGLSKKPKSWRVHM